MALIFSKETMFLRAHYLLRELVMLSFSVIICYSAIETGLYLLYRKKLISAFKLNKTSLGSGSRFRRQTLMLICLLRAKSFLRSHHFLYVVLFISTRGRERALMTRKSCALSIFNAILRINF